MKDGKAKPVIVTVPFKVDYLGNYTSMEVTEGCGDYPVLARSWLEGLMTTLIT